MPASQLVPNGGTDAQKKSLGRANAANFITSLCKYPGSSEFKATVKVALRKHPGLRAKLDL